jgi:hypothetical protein
VTIGDKGRSQLQRLFPDKLTDSITDTYKTRVTFPQVTGEGWRGMGRGHEPCSDLQQQQQQCTSNARASSRGACLLPGLVAGQQPLSCADISAGRCWSIFAVLRTSH